MNSAQRHPTSSLRLVVIITVAAFATETLIMLALPSAMPHPRFWLDAVLDSALLVLLLLPMLYFFMVRPLQLEIACRLQSETALRAAHAELEERVRERTLELTGANEALQREQRRCQGIAAEAQRRADELDAVFAVMGDAVFVYDANGVLLRGNPAALKMIGAETFEQLKAARLAQLPSVQAAGGQPLATDDLPFACALRGEIVRDRQLILADPDRPDLTILASASPLIANGSVSGAVSVWHDVTQHARLTALEERQHLARELHDSLSQTLFSIALGAHAALASGNDPNSKVVEAINYVLALADAGLTEMRALIFNLRPESLELEGLASALTKQAEALRTRYDMTVRVEIAQEPVVPLASKEAIYRIALEAMRNAAKHSHANELALTLSCSRDGLALEVSDDGVGFDPAKSYPGHLGLNSMRERAGQLQGTLQIHSAPGAGTRVHVDIPLAAGSSPVGGVTSARSAACPLAQA
jgi:signal transduction histidine kinase